MCLSTHYDNFVIWAATKGAACLENRLRCATLHADLEAAHTHSDETPPAAAANDSHPSRPNRSTRRRWSPVPPGCLRVKPIVVSVQAEASRLGSRPGGASHNDAVGRMPIVLVGGDVSNHRRRERREKRLKRDPERGCRAGARSGLIQGHRTPLVRGGLPSSRGWVTKGAESTACTVAISSVVAVQPECVLLLVRLCW